MPDKAPSSGASPQGRRVLVAVVTGEPGERIQAWRSVHDPEQASRIPPHTTLCYWANGLDLDELGAQVRHAFPAAIRVGLGQVKEFAGDEAAFYLELLETAELDRARDRLYDSTRLELGAPGAWPWHITCVRNPAIPDLEVLREASRSLCPGSEWLVNEIACLELCGEQYESVATWVLDRDA